jgi:signal transduction histidine kinase
MWLAFPSYAAFGGVWYWMSHRGLAKVWELWSFLGDIIATSVVLYLTRGFTSEFYIAYFLVILASCFLEELSYSFIVGGVACLVYGFLAFPEGGILEQPFYLLRTTLLLVTAFFSTYIAGVARRVERVTGDRFTEELAWMGRLSLVGRALAGVLHEVKTPVSTIILTTDYVRRLVRRGDDESVEAQLGVIEIEAQRAVEILGDFLEYTKPAALALKPLAVKTPLQRVLEAMKTRLNDGGISVDLDCEAGLDVMGSERHLVQVFTNLVMNSINAMPLGGRLDVAVRRIDSWAEIVVSDTGEGISADKLERLFEPFSSSRLDEGGHGLGLFIARWIVHKHSGALIARSAGKGRGTQMTVRLPLAAKS